ncbi:MAG: hypothetical protein ACRDZ9_01160 [Acidimicrobiales bacterium]
MSTGPSSGADRRVGRRDLEAKLEEIRSEVDSVAESSRNLVVWAGTAAAVGAAAVTYLLGRRRGHKRTTVVEVRRV